MRCNYVLLLVVYISNDVTVPAAYNGVFGGRQSHGGITTDGLVPVSTTLDTLGVFTRSAANHKKFIEAWYGQETYSEYSAFPKKLYRITNSTTGGFPVTGSEAQDLYDDFVSKLSAFLDAPITDLDPSVAWSQSGPVTEELLVYTNMVCHILTLRCRNRKAMLMTKL